MFDYVVTDYGVVGDDSTDNTHAIQDLVEQCAQTGGGTIYFPPGIYRTGPIKLCSYLTLNLAAGAKLLFDDSFDRYQPVYTRWSGYQCYAFSPLLFGENLKYVSIKGEGVIDGQGQSWWKIYHLLKQGKGYQSAMTDQIAHLNQNMTEPNETNLVEWPSQFLRPPLLQLKNCQYIKLEGITLQNSPFWNTHLVYCQHVTLNQLQIFNPSNTPNGDGLDVDSCQHVTITNCHFDVGDDCIAIKSGINQDGRNIGIPSENIAISNCTMLHGHGGVVLGSENSGGIKNIAISNCIFIGTDRGIRIKTNRARGGYIKQMLANNIVMEDCLCPIAVNAFYRYGVNLDDPLMTTPEPVPVTEKTPIIADLKFNHILAKKVRAAAGFIYGLPEMPIKNLTLHDVTLELDLTEDVEGGEPDMVKEELYMAGEGIYGQYIEGLIADQVRINTKSGPALQLYQSNDIVLKDVQTQQLHKDTPIVYVKAVEHLSIEGRQYRQLDDTYLKRE